MDWAFRGLFTAAAVTLAILTARRCDIALGGAIAGLPIVTAPWLVSVAENDGAAVAAQAATASVAVCIAMAVFAAVYARCARRAGIVGAATIALLVATAVVPVVRVASAHLDAAVALAAVACTLALLTLPLAVAIRPAPGPGVAIPLVATSAGIVGAASTSVAGLLGHFGASLFTALPVVGLATLIVEHRTRGASAVVACLRGYLAGLYGKIVFGLVFALAVPLGSTTTAIVAATLAGCATTFVGVRQTSRRGRRVRTADGVRDSETAREACGDATPGDLPVDASSQRGPWREPTRPAIAGGTNLIEAIAPGRRRAPSRAGRRRTLRFAALSRSPACRPHQNDDIDSGERPCPIS